jgi:hypothetical protein
MRASSCTENCPQRRVDLIEPIDLAVVAVSHEDCVTMQPYASNCRCADGQASTCTREGGPHIEPSLHGAAIYQPGTAGPSSGSERASEKPTLDAAERVEGS